MSSAVIVDAVRTPLGRRNGRLRSWHPVDLAAHTLEALVARNDLDPALVEDVIMGCVSQVGEQAANVGRAAALAAGFPESVVGTTIDRQCGSSQQAAHFAAQGVMAGAYDVVIAAGVESMTRVPMGSSMLPGQQAFGPRMSARYDLVPQGISAELIAEKWDIGREENDQFALESHRRAARATDEGRFENEIVAVAVVDDTDGDGRTELMVRDEGIRPDTSMEKLAQLKPVFKPEGGVITAANSSQITDGAAAVLIMSEERANALGLRPRARFHAFALERAKLTLDDVAVVEMNEAFSSVVLAWAREHHPDMRTVNPNGGAIALGHPLGCSGARLMATLLNELERTGGRYGLQTMCEGGGMANATIIERLG